MLRRLPCLLHSLTAPTRTAHAATRSGAAKALTLSHKHALRRTVTALSSAASRGFASAPPAGAQADADAETESNSVSSDSAAPSTHDSTAGDASAASASEASVSAAAPTRRRGNPAWASPMHMQILKEKGIKRPHGRGKKAGAKPGVHGAVETSDDAPVFKLSLQRGAPPPRPKLPMPAALAHIDRAWMQSQLTLPFAVPAASSADADASVPPHAHPFELRLQQWTGMETVGWQPPRRRKPRKRTNAAAGEDGQEAEADEDAADEIDQTAWIEAPEPTAAELEALAQADAGSGSIVWEAGLHLAHFLHSSPTLPLGPVLELGSGTGALGLAVDAMMQQAAKASPSAAEHAHTVVLTDGGKVMELLQHNAEANNSKALVTSFDWSDVSAFLSQSSLPPFYSTILCSELLDALPSAANGERAFGAESLRQLVDTVTQLVEHSAREKAARGVGGGVTVWFTFEQRGLLSLGPKAMLDAQLIAPLREAGIQVEQVFNETPYTKGSALCLFKMYKE